jgi:S-adenosylmethionine:tRNA ribosyltransferase-isomerase
MYIALFDYDLPASYIAQEPLKERDHSNLMILNKRTGAIQHKKFFDIIDYFQPGDLLVLNNSKVLPVRLYGYKKNTGGKIETFLIRPITEYKWEALLKPGKKTNIGTRIIYSAKLEAEVLSKNSEDGTFLLNMQADGDFNKILYEIGKMPTPPYIKKQLVKNSFYQTVYAAKEGSIAAPTAGFHFTERLLQRIKDKKIKIIFLTLHVGRGTFEKIRTEQVEEHKMKPEYYTISAENAKIINNAIKDERRIIGVGTSVTRALESSVTKGKVTEGMRRTSLFIYPGFKFQVLDALITNFHLPRSSPLMLASAFAGRKNLLNSYQEAIKKKYRFYSFGDAMFIV